MTREAALDSQALVYISDLGKKKAQALQADGNFVAVEFANKLVSVCVHADNKWRSGVYSRE